MLQNKLKVYRNLYIHMTFFAGKTSTMVKAAGVEWVIVGHYELQDQQKFNIVRHDHKTLAGFIKKILLLL